MCGTGFVSVRVPEALAAPRSWWSSRTQFSCPHVVWRCKKEKCKDEKGSRDEQSGPGWIQATTESCQGLDGFARSYATSNGQLVLCLKKGLCMILQRRARPPDCKKSASTLRQDHVCSRVRPAMSSMNTSTSQWLPAQIEDSRFEFTSVLPVCLASVPLGTAPQYASEAWLSFTLWISKSQGNCRIWYWTFRYIWLCFLRCATGMRWDLPHGCEIIKNGVPVGWCEICPLMCHGINYQPQLVQASAINNMSFEGKTSLIFFGSPVGASTMHRSSVVRRSSKGPGFGVCVCIYWSVTYNHIASFKGKMNLFTCLFFFWLLFGIWKMAGENLEAVIPHDYINKPCCMYTYIHRFLWNTGNLGCLIVVALT